jgi:hypothetical protein
MTIRVVNIGQANKGNGDPIRTAFDKINKNFEDLNNAYINLEQEVGEISTDSSLSEFDFGKIRLNNITNPLQLLFFTSTIDLGSISEPALVEYDAGDFE